MLRLSALAGLLATMPWPAHAQADVPQPDTQGGRFDDVLRTLNLKGRQAPTPDFVVKSRPEPGKLDYMPMGLSHPSRPKPMTPAEIAAATVSLDNARLSQQRRAGLKPVPVPDKIKQPAKKPVATTMH